MGKFFLLGLSLFCCSVLFAQTLRFDEFDGDDKIGEIIVTQRDSSGYKVYKLHSYTNFKTWLISIKATVFSKAVFENDGKFLSSMYQGKRDDEPSISTRASRTGDKIFVESGKEKRNFSGIVNFSTLQLFFSEPIGVTKIFSERTGEFKEMKSLGNHRYTAPFSRLEGIYTYTNGKLVAIEASTLFGTLKIKLAN